ncbi:Uma2 family endonuclease [Microcoleus sp. FACHB-68]|uniref:Uma2 family endonuclease n=1 Tax=Microcoleus sp. FACHB-68 TaxID=2692826 RepID=UPI00168893D6|nr:Uma2 family endonuclease [Microcoleus sp. FACHB-68]MBD1935987.1 Uma2 family endonuclease [Microcoleus sp. FACHB-68]
MSSPLLEKQAGLPPQEGCVTLHGVSWEQFEAIELALEGIAGTRLIYLDGTLDIMAPLSPEHEDKKRTINLLLETYFREKGIRFYARGGPTLGNREIRGRKKPDDSYNLETKKPVPDIIIEVVITSGGVNVLENYKRVRVPEVWFWQNGKLEVYHLGEQEYELCERSILLPELDLNLLAQYVNYSDQYDAVREFQKAISNQNTGT